MRGVGLVTSALMDSLEQVTHPNAGEGGGAGKVISISTKRENGATQQPPINRLNIKFQSLFIKEIGLGKLREEWNDYHY